VGDSAGRKLAASRTLQRICIRHHGPSLREENDIVDRCVNCQYYDRQDKGQGVGQCRREAPALSPINAKAYMIEGVWPTVRDDDWCGEWKSRVRRPESRVTEFLSMDLSSPATTSSRVEPASTVVSAMSTLAVGAAARGND
jgi:hypothetical protein